MDDMFGMLYNNLDPLRKLVTVVSNNMLDSLDKLIQDGVNLDAVLSQQNGNAALHIAAQFGHFGCVQKLLDNGATPHQENNFGFTPLQCALRQGHPSCAKVLLEKGTFLMDPNMIWRAQTMSGQPYWANYTPDCLKLLINASPDISWFDDSMIDSLLIGRHFELVKYFLVAGNVMDPFKLCEIVSAADDECALWLKNFRSSCLTLQHYARVIIRRHMKPNVLFSAKQLPLPSKLQEYLLINADTVSSVM